MDFRRRLDHETANRLLDGTIRPADAPPGFQAVAGLIAQARAVPTDTAGPSAIVAGLAEAVLAAPVPSSSDPQRTTSMLARILRPKTAIAAIAAVTLAASGAAAGTGALPDSAQHHVAKVVDHVGIHLADPVDDQADNETDAPEVDNETDAPEVDNETDAPEVDNEKDAPEVDNEKDAPEVKHHSDAPEQDAPQAPEAGDHSDDTGE